MRAKHRIEAAIVRAGFRLGNLFPWGWISGTGAALGWLLWHVLRVRRGVVLRNLELALGDTLDAAARRRIGARCYRQWGRSYLEIFGLPSIRRRGVLARVDYEGLEHVEAARAHGRGVLFIAPHMGNPEVMAFATLALGHPVHLIVGDLANPAVDGVLNGIRAALGFRIERRGMGLRGVVKALRDGAGVGIQGDQEARWHGITVPFFGMESLTHPGAAHLSLRTGAPLVPAFCVRAGRRFTVRFDAPIVPAGDPDDEAVRALTAAHTLRLEAAIRRHPEQWFWLHDRWKRAPRGEDGRPRRSSRAG